MGQCILQNQAGGVNLKKLSFAKINDEGGGVWTVPYDCSIIAIVANGASRYKDGYYEGGSSGFSCNGGTELLKGYQGDVDGHRITSAYGIYVDVPKGTQINTWGGYYQKSRVIMYAKK